MKYTQASPGKLAARSFFIALLVILPLYSVVLRARLNSAQELPAASSAQQVAVSARDYTLLVLSCNDSSRALSGATLFHFSVDDNKIYVTDVPAASGFIERTSGYFDAAGVRDSVAAALGITINGYYALNDSEIESVFAELCSFSFTITDPFSVSDSQGLTVFSAERGTAVLGAPAAANMLRYGTVCGAAQCSEMRGRLFAALLSECLKNDIKDLAVAAYFNTSAAAYTDISAAGMNTLARTLGVLGEQRTVVETVPLQGEFNDGGFVLSQQQQLWQ